MPEAAQPKLTLQLSSPVEEAVLSGVEDAVTFSGVETGQATLSVSCHDAEIPLGSSAAACDVATFTHELLDALQPAASYVTDLVVPITNTGVGVGSSLESDATVTTTSTTDSTICTVTLKVTYTPSVKDQREELYELIEKVSNAKAAAREDLRKAALELHEFQQSKVVQKPAKSPAVQAGFLNKGSGSSSGSGAEKNQNKPAKWKVWYERAEAILPIAKNYMFFLGFVVVSHFYGQNLAIPAPV